MVCRWLTVEYDTDPMCMGMYRVQVLGIPYSFFSGRCKCLLFRRVWVYYLGDTLTILGFSLGNTSGQWVAVLHRKCPDFVVRTVVKP